MSVLKKLASETALYGVSSILGRVINYALVGLHTKVFFAGQMAIQIELYAAVGILNILYTYGMETAFFRYAAREKNKASDYYNLVQSAIIISSLLMSGLIYAFASPIINWFGYPNNDLLVRWLAIIVAIDAIVAIPFARLRLEKKAKKFVSVRLANIFINVGLNFFFFWFCKGIQDDKFLLFLKPVFGSIYSPVLGVGYIVLANLIANAAFIPMLWRELTNFKFKIDVAQFKILWVYAYPILIMGLAGTVNLMADRLMLKDFLPLEFYPHRTSKDALGIYGNCYKLSIFMALATQAFRYAAEPFFFSKAQDRNAPQVFAEVMKWFVIVCVAIWLAVCLNLDWISKLFLRKPEYLEGLVVVPVLLLANLFLGVYNNLAIWFKLSDKTGYGTMITFVGMGITLLLNWLLIPYLGYMGCAITFLISCFSMTLLCYLLGQKYYPIPYNALKIMAYIASAGLLIWANNGIKISNTWVAFAYHSILFGLYMLVVLVIERQDLPKRFREKLAFLN